MTAALMTAVARRPGSGERGASLVVVAVATASLAMLGLGVLALGALESEATSAALHSRQASLAAESGLDLVKHWFDAPSAVSGEWLVPGAAEVDRAQRRVDPEGDGTWEPMAGAPAPWNVRYREAAGDLFERPFDGSPSLRLEGDPRGPDLTIDEGAPDPAVRVCLARINAALFPGALAPGLFPRLRRIAVFAAPRVRIGGRLRQVGVGTIEVTAAVVRTAGGAEIVVASARASGILQEIPYGLTGPLSTSGDLAGGEGIDARWGEVRAGGEVSLGSDPRARTPGGWPRRSASRRLVLDADGDGTIDDRDGDGTADLDEWTALADATLADPWYALLAGGAIAGAPTGVMQPYPFDPALVPGAYATDDDRSGLFQGLGPGLAAPPDMPVFRAAASDGGAAAHLFRYVAGSAPPLFREGSGPAADLESATRGREGLFVFDTADGLAPRDENGDGTADNLTPAIVVGDADWSMSGCLVVGSFTLVLPASTRPLYGWVAPPGEPIDDVDGDGTCEEGDSFLGLIAPSEPLAAGAEFTRSTVRLCSGGASPAPGGAPSYVPLTVAGVILATGHVEGGAGARVFGGVSAAAGITGPDPAAPFQILFDERLARHEWPPPGSRLPRTVWQRRSASP